MNYGRGRSYLKEVKIKVKGKNRKKSRLWPLDAVILITRDTIVVTFRGKANGLVITNGKSP